MDGQSPTTRNFVAALRNHWLEAMSGSASVPFAIWAVFAGEPYQQRILAAASVFCLLFAAYRMWASERKRVNDLLSQADIAAATREQAAAIREQTAALRHSPQGAGDVRVDGGTGGVSLRAGDGGAGGSGGPLNIIGGSAHAPILPDMPIHDLFFHIQPDILENPDEHRWQALGREMMDKFGTGQLNVWGREIDPATKRGGALAPISPDYWRNRDFIYHFLQPDKGLGVVNGGELAHTYCWQEPKALQYADLQVNRAQAMSVWPTSREGAAHAALDWKEPVEAIYAFCDQEAVARCRRYQQQIVNATKRGHEIEDKMRAIRDADPAGGFNGRPESLKEYNSLRDRLERMSDVASHADTGMVHEFKALHEEIAEKLLSGEVIARGFAEPHSSGREEVQIKPSEWRIIILNPYSKTAVKNGTSTIVYSGVQIAQVRK